MAPTRQPLLAPAVLLLFAAACAEPPPEIPPGADEETQATAVAAAQDAFWNNLRALCGEAFSGKASLVRGTDADFSAGLVVHFRECEPDEMRIPLHVGDDRSRTWVLSRTSDGLRLKHDHRHEDGTEEELTQYGGETEGPGSPHRQAFHADRATAEMLPEASTNVWSVEIVPGEAFVYQLERMGTDRLVRLEFDLTRSVEAPPPPWGSEES